MVVSAPIIYWDNSNSIVVLAWATSSDSPMTWRWPKRVSFPPCLRSTPWPSLSYAALSLPPKSLPITCPWTTSKPGDSILIFTGSYIQCNNATVEPPNLAQCLKNTPKSLILQHYKRSDPKVNFGAKMGELGFVHFFLNLPPKWDIFGSFKTPCRGLRPGTMYVKSGLLN